jgi:intracellular multiplication protein IcmD
MLEDVALICGVGFILASFFKFHQHKLNPTQVPMSQGVTLLVIGAGLSVFPHLLNTASSGVFGASVAKLGSGGIGSIISS